VSGEGVYIGASIIESGGSGVVAVGTKVSSSSEAGIISGLSLRRTFLLMGMTVEGEGRELEVELAFKEPSALLLFDRLWGSGDRLRLEARGGALILWLGIGKVDESGLGFEVPVLRPRSALERFTEEEWAAYEAGPRDRIAPRPEMKLNSWYHVHSSVERAPKSGK
jgi:hypothetical protein